MINKYLEKYSKCNKKLDLLYTFFGAAYKSFYRWRLIDEKVSVASALNAGIGISLKCGIDISLIIIQIIVTPV